MAFRAPMKPLGGHLRAVPDRQEQRGADALSAVRARRAIEKTVGKELLAALAEHYMSKPYEAIEGWRVAEELVERAEEK